MAISPDILLDGNWLKAEPVNAPRWEWPFRRNGDRWSALFEQDYWQTWATFTPQELGTPFVPGSDFYFIKEDAYRREIADILLFTRTISRIPTVQTVPTSIQLFRPALTGTLPQMVGNYRVFQPDTTLESYDAYARKTVNSDSGIPSGNYPTGGTYKLGLAGTDSAGIAFGADAATVTTALNLVTPVSNRGNVVVTGAYNAAGGFTATFNPYATATVNLASLTGGTGATFGSTIGTASGGYVQSFNLSATGIDASSPDITDSTTGGTNTWKQVLGGSGASTTFISLALTSTSAPISGGSYTITLYAQTTAAIAWNANAATIQAAVNLALTNAAARGTVVVTTNSSLYSINIGIQITPVISGGTFTATIFGQTTGAIAYNAALPTIQTAFNALSEVQTKRGGVIVSGAGFANGVMAFTISFSNALLVATTSSLTPAGSAMTVTSADGGVNRIQTITFNATNNTRTFYVSAGHGIAASDTIMIRNAVADYSGIKGNFTVPNAQTVTLTVLPTDAFATAATITEIGRLTKKAYQPGYSNIPAKLVTTFYLPGVSPGIATADDIPVPISQADNTSLLSAIFVGSGTLNWEGGRLSPWRDSVILKMETTTINVANV